MEHRDGQNENDRGKESQVGMVHSDVDTRGDAAELEAELKEICDKNPRRDSAWLLKFKDLVYELNYTWIVSAYPNQGRQE